MPGGVGGVASRGVPLSRLQDFADRQAALERRLSALEEAIAAQPAVVSAANTIAEPSVSPPLAAGIKWPHMVDNIFLGLSVVGYYDRHGRKLLEAARWALAHGWQRGTPPLHG